MSVGFKAVQCGQAWRYLVPLRDITVMFLGGTQLRGLTMHSVEN